ncbi:MAG: hypothetical protein E7462_03720 [Ruminococcaceae bacterium]|nr:hypothetical protein [Oscillospiraceae bacterium]
MKSRTSFFSWPVFKKDITRFLPLWVIYLVGMLLIVVSTVSVGGHRNPARELGRGIGALALINFTFALISAQLLFGELFKSRLCNALHAMPVRRETRFISHVLAGLSFGVIPNLIIALLIMPILETFWFTSLLWVGAMTLQYLFFFGVAVLAMLLCGSRFATVLMYFLINFLAMVVLWFIETIYLPMTPGVVINYNIFHQFVPFVEMPSQVNYFIIELPKNIGVEEWQSAQFIGFGESWGYLLICAGVGIGMLALAFCAYRRRALETAGDFIAVKGIRPVFLVLYTLCSGAFLSIFGSLFTVFRSVFVSSDGNSGIYWIFLLVGLIGGFFVGKMLLARTIRVFQWKSFLHLGILTIALLLTLAAAKLDVLGIVRYVPDAQSVQNVRLNGSYHSTIKFEDETEIQGVCRLHQMAIEDNCDRTCGKRHSEVMLEYQLKNGWVVKRIYTVCKDSTADWMLEALSK